MRYDIYVYQNNILEEMEEIFYDLNPSTQIQYLSQSLMLISLTLSVEEDLIDLHMVHASIISDFGVDTTFIYLKTDVYQYIHKDIIAQHIIHLSKGVYDVSTLLQVFAKIQSIKASIKRLLVDFIGQENVDTILMVAKMNMNFSLTAKKLFLHRNSLNYRIDKIHQMTDIDVKTFKGLRALVSILE